MGHPIFSPLYSQLAYFFPFHKPIRQQYPILCATKEPFFVGGMCIVDVAEIAAMCTLPLLDLQRNALLKEGYFIRSAL
jgi:hypothetical protein